MLERRPSQNQKIDRRKFLGTAAAAGAVGYFVNPGSVVASNSPNERLNLACVGSSNRAGANIAALKSQNIVAIADIDSNLLDKGCEPYPHAKKYRDFRVMLEKESEKHRCGGCRHARSHTRPGGGDGHAAEETLLLRKATGSYGKGMSRTRGTGGQQSIKNSNGNSNPCTRQLPAGR